MTAAKNESKYTMLPANKITYTFPLACDETHFRLFALIKYKRSRITPVNFHIVFLRGTE